MRGVSQTEPLPATRRRRPLRGWLAAVGVLGLLVGAAFVWTAPREDVAVPGRGASPKEVVIAYIDAVNARDFETANAIDARPGSDLGRFSRPMRTHLVRMEETVTAGAAAHVLFTADFVGGDGTIDDGLWGYYLDRGSDGRWHITDAGVA